MSYRLIKGTFSLFYYGERHVGSRPDGDSVWFRPDKPSLLSNLGDPPRDADFNGGGLAQLRFEGIDALELHYPGSDHQHATATVAARDFLLRSIGFSQVEYAPNPDIATYVRSSTPESIQGYILTRNIDPYRRPVAFVYAGSAAESDGADVFLLSPRLNLSLNAKLMSGGQVYPAYYTGLPVDLRERLTRLAQAARGSKRGLWAVDDSRDNPRVRDKQALMRLAIWPKLYRRLAKYFNDDNKGLARFDRWLRADAGARDDALWIISRGEYANLHDIVKVKGNRINMKFWPEDLVIVPR